MTETLSCPYPWCSSPSFQAGALSTDSAASCASCGSVASRCPERACGAWNRAFARWCRRCGRNLEETRAIWDGLRTLAPAGGATGMGRPELVADLSKLDGEPKSRAHRVAIAPAQGFLALHQAGGFIALVRPFGSGDQELAFERREEATDSASRATPAHAPLMMPDGRRLLLADRRAAAVLDLWDAPISADPPSADPWRRLAPSAPIVADPIPLRDSRVGLLLGGPSAYSWLVWDVAAAKPERTAAPLPGISGGPCEAARASREVLAFATPEGHWAWRVDDALAGTADALVQTWSAAELDVDPDQEPIRVELSRRVHNAESFATPGQVFQADEDDGGRFHWYFHTTDGQARSHRVLAPELKIDGRFAYPRATPVGVARRSGERATVIFERNDALLWEREIKDQLAESPARLPGEGWAGLLLVGDLIVTIGNARGEPGSRRIQVQSLWEGRAPLHAGSIVGLAADPLIWAGHLFTLERPDPHALVLNRRSLSTP